MAAHESNEPTWRKHTVDVEQRECRTRCVLGLGIGRVAAREFGQLQPEVDPIVGIGAKWQRLAAEAAHHRQPLGVARLRGDSVVFGQ